MVSNSDAQDLAQLRAHISAELDSCTQAFVVVSMQRYGHNSPACADEGNRYLTACFLDGSLAADMKTRAMAQILFERAARLREYGEAVAKIAETRRWT